MIIVKININKLFLFNLEKFRLISSIQDNKFICCKREKTFLLPLICNKNENVLKYKHFVCSINCYEIEIIKQKIYENVEYINSQNILYLIIPQLLFSIDYDELI